MAAAHTFLKKNPDDYKLTKNMNYYKSLLDVEEYLIDHEEQPYEVRLPAPSPRPGAYVALTFSHIVFQSVFLKSVTLYNSGDFSSSARNMEEALAQYFEIYKSCVAACEGSYEILEFKDFYPTLAGKTGPAPDSRRNRRARLICISSLRSLHGCPGLQGQMRGKPDAERRRLLCGEVCSHHVSLPSVFLLQM